jgi:hypothetical protein
MKIFSKHFGLAALAIASALAVMACEIDSTLHDKLIVHETAGQLTLTGLDTYNGKHIVALGAKEGKNLLAASALSGETVTGGTVSGGSVTLKVWKYVSDTEWAGFDGTGEIIFTVDVFAVPDVELHGDHYHAYKLADELASEQASATFANGVGAGGFTNAEFTVHETTGRLTLTGLEAYNDSYVVALGRDGNNKRLLAGSAIPEAGILNGGVVTDGSVTLKVWRFVNNMEWESFNGTENALQFSVAVLEKPGAELHNDHYHYFSDNPRLAEGYVVTNFAAGVAVGAFEGD